MSVICNQSRACMYVPMCHNTYNNYNLPPTLLSIYSVYCSTLVRYTLYIATLVMYN